MPVAAEDHPGDERLDHECVQPGGVPPRHGLGRHGRGSGQQHRFQGDRKDRARAGESPWAPIASGAHGPERRHRGGRWSPRGCPDAGRPPGGRAPPGTQRDRRSRCPVRRARRSRCRRTATRRSRVDFGFTAVAPRRPSRRPRPRRTRTHDLVLHRCGHRDLLRRRVAVEGDHVRRPWIVDSAPEFWFALPVRGDTVEGDTGRRVVGRRQTRSRRRTTRPHAGEPPRTTARGEERSGHGSPRRRRSASRRRGSGGGRCPDRPRSASTGRR